MRTKRQERRGGIENLNWKRFVGKNILKSSSIPHFNSTQLTRNVWELEIFNRQKTELKWSEREKEKKRNWNKLKERDRQTKERKRKEKERETWLKQRASHVIFCGVGWLLRNTKAYPCVTNGFAHIFVPQLSSCNDTPAILEPEHRMSVEERK